MSALKHLGQQPNGNVSLKAYCDWLNYCQAALMSEAEVTARILRTMRPHGASETQIREAIQRGFYAARKK